MSAQINTDNPRSAPSVMSPSSIRAAASPSDVFHTGHSAYGCTFSHVYGTHSPCSCAFRCFHTGHFARGCTFSHVYDTHSLCSCAFRCFHTGHFARGCTFSHVCTQRIRSAAVAFEMFPHRAFYLRLHLQSCLRHCSRARLYRARVEFSFHLPWGLLLVSDLCSADCCWLTEHFHLKTQLLDAINPTTWSRCHHRCQ